MFTRRFAYAERKQSSIIFAGRYDTTRVKSAGSSSMGCSTTRVGVEGAVKSTSMTPEPSSGLEWVVRSGIGRVLRPA